MLPDDMLCRACVKEGARLQIEHGETRITCFLQHCYAEIELEVSYYFFVFFFLATKVVARVNTLIILFRFPRSG